MPDNFVSYNRFTTMPPNIADFGATVDEIKIQRGQPDKNPVLSPMATPRLSLRRLALKPRGSDHTRLSEPSEPTVDPYEGARPASTILREAAAKLAGELVPSLDAHIANATDIAGPLREPMRQSCRRVAELARHLTQTNAMTNLIQGRTLATRQG